MKGSPTQEDPWASDIPPSYDYATAQPPVEESQAGPSSSTSTSAATAASEGSGSGTIPKSHLHLFSGPPNAEPLFGHISSSLGELGDIAVRTKGSTSESWDPKLGNGQSYFLVACEIVLTS
jgi:hypothetical protein